MFEIHELVPPEIYLAEGEAAWRYIDQEAKRMLFDFRQWIEKPCTVNDYHWGGQFEWSGMRTPAKAKALGSPRSLHKADLEAGILCRAFDVKIAGEDYDQLRARIRMDQDNPLLARINRMEAGVNWLHIDRGSPPAGRQRIYLFQV
jgi:hypothetical protein